MSEPYWTPLGGQPVDYEGNWVADTQYAPGDVVVYNGVNYLAVNPSLGVTPPANLALPFMGTSLPSTPFDGMIFTLVDSLTAPTYAWRFQYVAAKATNKWVFIGGSPVIDQNDANAIHALALGVWGDPTSGGVGPQFTVPVAGDYRVGWGFLGLGQGGSGGYPEMGIKIGAAAVANDDQISGSQTARGPSTARVKRFNGVVAGTLIKAQYRMQAGGSFNLNTERWLEVLPIAVGG